LNQEGLCPGVMTMSLYPTIAYFIYAFDFNLFVLADCMSNAGIGADLTGSSRKEREGLKCGLSDLFYYYNIYINIIIS
jgi:hypothetical protein